MFTVFLLLFFFLPLYDEISNIFSSLSHTVNNGTAWKFFWRGQIWVICQSKTWRLDN